MAVLWAAIGACLTSGTEGALPRSGIPNRWIQIASNSDGSRASYRRSFTQPKPAVTSLTLHKGQLLLRLSDPRTAPAQHVGPASPTEVHGPDPPFAGTVRPCRLAAAFPPVLRPGGSGLSLGRAAPSPLRSAASLETCFSSLSSAHLGSSPNFPSNRENRAVFPHLQTPVLTPRSPRTPPTSSTLGCGGACVLEEHPEFPTTGREKTPCNVGPEPLDQRLPRVGRGDTDAQPAQAPAPPAAGWTPHHGLPLRSGPQTLSGSRSQRAAQIPPPAAPPHKRYPEQLPISP